MDLDLKGRIEQFNLPEIFQLVAAGRKSGTLGIEHDDAIVMIYFKEGNIIYGYGPRQTYHLGQLLKEHGVLDDAQLNEAISIQSRTENSQRLGEIMISRKLISRIDLETVVRKQIEELLFNLMTWQKGSFKFYEDQFPTDEEITVKISVENVILEGLRRADELKMINDALPNFNETYRLAPTESDRTREVSLRGEEWNIVSLIDGHRTITDACEASPYERQVTLRGLAQMKLAGIIEKAEPGEPRPPRELEGMIGRLANLFDEYLTEKSSSSSESSKYVTSQIAEKED